MIQQISFKNYKLFKALQELKLCPITILIGKNSSGKSAIAKLPTLIGGSLTGEFSQPLKWENEGIKLGNSYRDLVYNKNITTSYLQLSIESEEEKLDVTITGDSKDRTEFLEYIFNNEPLDLKKNKFRGFTNDKFKFKNLNLNFDYIGAFRKIPEPNYTNSFDVYQKIGIEGENAYPILIQDFEDSDGELITKVSQWYEANFEGWNIDILPISAPEPTFQVVFSNKDINQINIVNVGQGMNQALPLIVRSYLFDEEDVLIIIEEPETHLHPAAHGNLAERFVESYLENNKKNYLIETHSKNFVLRMRRLVAEGKLKKEDLAIYYVDFKEDINQSIIQRIEIDEFGGVKDWPEHIFSETLTETRAIRNAQLKHLADVG